MDLDPRLVESFKPVANLAVGGTDEDLLNRAGVSLEPDDDDGGLEEPAGPPSGFAPPIAAHIDPNGLASALIAADDERARRANVARQREQSERALADMFKPPESPKGKELQALIEDEQALKTHLEARDQWVSDTLKRGLGFITQLVEQRVDEAQRTALTPVYEDRRRAAMNQVWSQLNQLGVPDPEGLLTQLDRRLGSGDPQAYWRLVSDPHALMVGARAFAAERGIDIGGLAPASGLDYTGGRTAPPARSFGNEAVWAKVEHALGRKVDPAYRAALGRQG